MADLEQLHSNVPPEPYAQAREVIVAALGDAPEALLASFEEDAFAAALTAQVHRATLADGTCVAVKVQRPDIDAMVRADFGVLRDVVDLASRASRTVRDLALAPLLDEFAGGVGRELDYRNEAYHAMRLADAMAAFPSTRCPRSIAN